MSDADINAVRRKFARACSAMGTIRKDKTADAGSYTYNYADLTSVLQVVKEALEGEGLTLSQPIVVRDGALIVTTMLTDVVSGEYLLFDGPGCPLKGDPQAQGSAISYNRRYALTSLFALEVEDDDGALAHRADTRPQERTEAEAEIRRMLKTMSKDDQSKFADDFKVEFGSTLTNLPENRHGDALKFAKFWSAVDLTIAEEPTLEGTT